MSRDPCFLGPLINTKASLIQAKKTLIHTDIKLKQSTKVPDNGAEGLCFREMLQPFHFQESSVWHFLAWLGYKVLEVD